MSIAEHILDRLFEYQEIRDGCEGDSGQGSVYLKRWFLVMNDNPERSGTPQKSGGRSFTIHRDGNGFQVYLHCIKRSDGDRELHDHPWSFVSVMLWRGYFEETEENLSPLGWVVRRRLARKWPGMILVRGTTWRHRVRLAGKPAWSLIFTTGKRRMWCFWRDGTPIPWRRFLAEKCAQESQPAGERSAGA